MDDRYAGPEMVEARLKACIAGFPKITNNHSNQLFELLDPASEIAARKDDVQYSTLLAYCDSSVVVNPIASKLPVGLQDKWTTHGIKYKKIHGAPYPPFPIFVEFLRDIAKARNDPGFRYEQPAVFQ